MAWAREASNLNAPLHQLPVGVFVHGSHPVTIFHGSQCRREVISMGTYESLTESVAGQVVNWTLSDKLNVQQLQAIGVVNYQIAIGMLFKATV